MRVRGRKVEEDNLEARGFSLYLHVPFCISKCLYCDFYSVPLASLPEPDKAIESYPKLLIKEFSKLQKSYDLEPYGEIKSIFFGGGTPTLLSPDGIEHILKELKTMVGVKDDIEVTIEANPDTVSEDKLKGFIEAGVNRLSVGVQSLNEESLKTLGRCHTKERAVAAFHEARAAGFTNISIDLIYGTPGESIEEFRETLEKAAKLKAEHLSLYALTLEEGTLLKKKVELNEVTMPPEEDDLEKLRVASTLLPKSDLTRYEISNFSTPCHQCIHNLNYWGRGSYIGLGPSSHSFLSKVGSWGRRWWNKKDLAEYTKAIENIEENNLQIEGFEDITKESAALERLMLGLRLTEGISIAGFKKEFDVEPSTVLSNFSKLMELGYLEVSGDTLRLTRGGMEFHDEVF